MMNEMIYDGKGENQGILQIQSISSFDCNPGE